MNIPVFEFKGKAKGPALLVFGAVHGNETCGTHAITQVMTEISRGKIILLRGSLTLVPIANPLAFKKKTRFVDENLNRIFRPTKKATTREACFANSLCGLVDTCDVLLDIHSTTAPGKPFIYLDFPTPRNRALARTLGPQIAVAGWPELYKKLGKKHQSFDTTSYAARRGKEGLLIECGQHQAKTAPAVAYRAILQMLRHYGLIKGATSESRLREIRMTAGFFRESAKDKLAKNWRQFEKVRRGAPLIMKADGSVIKARYNATIIMPKADAAVGQDWLYLGR